MTPDQIKKYAEELKSSATADIARFQKNMETNPKYAFEWATGAMEGAARLHVAEYLTEWFARAEEMGSKPAAVARAMIAHATAETFRMATSTGQSTSITSNAMERYTMAVWAALASKAFDKVRFSGDNGSVVFIYHRSDAE